jgi:hypothetical protein
MPEICKETGAELVNLSKLPAQFIEERSGERRGGLSTTNLILFVLTMTGKNIQSNILLIKQLLTISSGFSLIVSLWLKLSWIRH